MRSIIAVPAGWVAAFGTYVVVMIIVAIFYPEPFKPGVQPSTGWLLVILSVGFVCWVIGGFVTGIIAQRREIAHALGLVLFTFLLSLYFLYKNRNASPVPRWYMITGYILDLPSPLLGGWLRMKQAVLIGKIPESVTRTWSEAWLSVAIAIDHLRFPIAIAASIATFVLGLWMGILLTGAGVLAIQRVFGVDHHGGILVPGGMIASFLLSCLVSRRVFRKIMAVDTSLLSDRNRE